MHRAFPTTRSHRFSRAMLHAFQRILQQAGTLVAEYLAAFAMHKSMVRWVIVVCPAVYAYHAGYYLDLLFVVGIHIAKISIFADYKKSDPVPRISVERGLNSFRERFFYHFSIVVGLIARGV